MFYLGIQTLEIFNLNLFFCFGNTAEDCEIADNVEPSLLNWAPYIGKKSRRKKFLYNTKHRKVSRHTQELEKNCREVTEERILELLSQSKASDVAKLAKNLG